MSVTVGPFQKLKNIHFPTNAEAWIIIEAGSGGGYDSDYVGQGDGVRANPSFINTTSPAQIGPNYTSLGSANTAWATESALDRPIARRLLHWVKSTAHPTIPATPTSAGWNVANSVSGILHFSAAFGQIGAGFPDPNCPPSVLNVVVDQATSGHVQNYFDWQRALNGGVLHASQTILQDGVPISCAVGDP